MHYTYFFSFVYFFPFLPPFDFLGDDDDSFFVNFPGDIVYAFVGDDAL